MTAKKLSAIFCMAILMGGFAGAAYCAGTAQPRKISFRYAPPDNSVALVKTTAIKKHSKAGVMVDDVYDTVTLVVNRHTSTGYATLNTIISIDLRQNGHYADDPISRAKVGIPFIYYTDKHGDLKTVRGFDLYIRALHELLPPSFQSTIDQVFRIDTIMESEIANWKERYIDYKNRTVAEGESPVRTTISNPGTKKQYSLHTKNLFRKATGFAPKDVEIVSVYMPDKKKLPKMAKGFDYAKYALPKISGNLMTGKSRVVIDPLTMLKRYEENERVISTEYMSNKPGEGRRTVLTTDKTMSHYDWTQGRHEYLKLLAVMLNVMVPQQGRAALTKDQVTLLNVWTLDSSVRENGFASYFSSAVADPAVADSFDAIGLPEAAAIVRQAAAASKESDAQKALSDLGVRYLASSPDYDGRMFGFVVENKVDLFLF